VILSRVRKVRLELPQMSKKKQKLFSDTNEDIKVKKAEIKKK